MRLISIRPIRVAFAALAISALAAPIAYAAEPARVAAAAAPAAPSVASAAVSATVPAAGDTTLTGTLRVAIADDFKDAKSQTFYSLETADGLVQLGVSGTGADTLDGALVSVTGNRQSDGSVAVAAGSFVVRLPAAANPAARAKGASPNAAATRKVVVIVADYTDLAGFPVTQAQADATFTTDPASVKSWFDATSRGRVTTATTILYGWHLGIAQCPGGTSNWQFVTTLNAALTAAQNKKVDLSGFDHVVVWTKTPCQQNWAGVGYVPGRYVQLAADWATYNWDEPALSAMVASHELGHNLGLYHSNGLACYDRSHALPDGSYAEVELNDTCQDAEYYDEFSTMGMAGSSAHSLLDADRLLSLGWLAAGESQTVTAGGTYSLVPVYSASPGVRLLRISRPIAVLPAEQQVGSWTLELRSALTGTAWDQFTGLPFSTAVTGVTIRYSEDETRAAGELGASYLIDTVPDGTTKAGISFRDAPLQPGGTFTDSVGGFTVTVDSVSGSGASVTIGDIQPPTAPLTVDATGVPTGGGQVDWQPATDNFGVAHYRVYRDGVQIAEVSGGTLTYVDPPAAFGGFHTYGVAAVDAAGLVGPMATHTATLVPLPGPPTGVTALPGNAEIMVSWTAPAVGAPIIAYNVTATAGGFTCATTGATSCIVTGLSNGTPYSFTVTATNPVGTGDPSLASNSATPLLVPGRPTAVSGIAGDTTVDVTWTAPADTGASSIGGYTVAASPGIRTCSTAGSIGCTVTGLTNGTVYTFTVRAANSLGLGLPSVPSAGVTPRTRPNPPINVTALASNGQALVAWSAPPFDGGSPVTAYDVISSPDGRVCHTTGARFCTVTSLTNRTWYSFTVTATNVAGTSDSSAASAQAMPLRGSTYVTVTPNRLVDSRNGTRIGLAASLKNKVPVSFQVTGRSANPALNIPAGAVAVTGNLTALNEGQAGFFSLTPDKPSGTPSTSTINFPAGDIRANAVTVPLGAGGVLWITYVGGAGKIADVVFDVTGYFIGNTSGATYLPLTPNRIVDSRTGARVGLSASLTSGTAASFQVTGRSADVALNVPANAIAVTGNLTAVGEGSNGYFSLTPAKPSGNPTTSTINFPAGDTRANAVTVPLGAGGVLWVTFVGAAGKKADVLFDVTGYFVPDKTGSTFVTIAPGRLVDSRAPTHLGLSAALASGTPVQVAAVGSLTIPADAIAISGNLTSVGASSRGYFALTPDEPAGQPTTSSVNFPAGETRANAVVVPLKDGGAWVTFVGTAGAQANVLLDVSGYFTMN
jgi:hypothetical protein